jgi:WD40 repeat protein
LVIVLKDDAFYVGKRGTSFQLEKYSSTTQNLQLVYEGHQDSVFAVFLWEDLIFSGSGDTKIICWNEGNGQIIRIFEAHTAAVLVISVFDSYLYSGGQKAVILKWNIDSGIVDRTFPSLHADTI